jgi:Ca2+-binding RTX toxin-like protein
VTGNDTIDSGSYADDQGNDELAGDEGNDAIVDWVGNDLVGGGSGDDWIHVRDGYCHDYVDGGPGTDEVYADSCDTIRNAEYVYKTAAGAKSTAKQERPTPPDLSKEDSKQSEEDPK